mmetsp:Transcript_49273/g.107207  ORF Transcript_49273/g.107207 Transcript_49273/m.107207 type:complete len:329 (+) Transcript_49273:90-1076(+)|eukprot:CAMPEP_0170602388 /NCGR_PEP_ID=MMETSP0224-20130122/18363_1 /TAXON_ID=285029 /ORGANISM="Togula jolla, Strain CCCM 725" /LENGTH=328 /DNA_ID=CAMNT_0010927221 /DNA_START=85 /DNA_END=1071 /DNA_ORIENTATION=-
MNLLHLLAHLMAMCAAASSGESCPAVSSNAESQDMANSIEGVSLLSSGLLLSRHDGHLEPQLRPSVFAGGANESAEHNCPSAAGVKCMCEDPKYPCYKSAPWGCGCWSHSHKGFCEESGGSFCERPPQCVKSCSLCRDEAYCSKCEDGFMVVGGACVSRPKTVEETWVKAHNILRCVHGARPVVWSEAVAAGAKDVAINMTVLKHSHSYALKPPAGPSEENLAAGHPSVEAAVNAWFEQRTCCKALPGCENIDCPASSFTAMVWNSVLEIGCASSNHTRRVDVCHYRSGDFIGADTANMGGYYKENVLPEVRSLDYCIQLAEADHGAR